MFLRSFIKRSRPLSKNKQLILEEFLPKFKIKLPEVSKLPEKYDTINLEIGFGKGDFLVNLALTERKQSLNIGCDPYTEGVISLLRKIEQHNVKNIMIWPDDASLLLTKITNHSLNNVYILFPDPWPKKKHQKRRLINPHFVELLSNKLKSHATVFVATDHYDYASSIYSCFEASKGFTCEDISAVSKQFFKHASTRYHEKNIEGKEIRLLKFNAIS